LTTPTRTHSDNLLGTQLRLQIAQFPRGPLINKSGGFLLTRQSFGSILERTGCMNSPRGNGFQIGYASGPRQQCPAACHHRRKKATEHRNTTRPKTRAHSTTKYERAMTAATRNTDKHARTNATPRHRAHATKNTERNALQSLNSFTGAGPQHAPIANQADLPMANPTFTRQNRHRRNFLETNIDGVMTRICFGSAPRHERRPTTMGRIVRQCCAVRLRKIGRRLVQT